MSEHNFTRTGKLTDQYGNRYHLAGELARGGQGVVYRTTDADVAVKQPLATDGNVDRTLDLQLRFQNVRCLPLPPRIPIALPLAVLRDEPGYVMSLLSGMEPFGAFSLGGKAREDLASEPIPGWLRHVDDRNAALGLMHYARSGSTKRRLGALAKVAAILARLHATGLVYGDVSPQNCFMGRDDSDEVWLVDADNLRLERITGGGSVYTPRYGAPEVVRGSDQARPRTDAWAFAVMAFETLALVHPFIGQKVLEASDDGGWDADSVADEVPSDLDEQAYAGYLPFVDDKNDHSNRGLSGLPRELVLTPALVTLFQETLGAGRSKPWRRPALGFWALELTRAHDLSVNCPGCAMSYRVEHARCPYCDSARPTLAIAVTDRWRMVCQPHGAETKLPHRLFHAFSPERHGKTEFEAVLDFRRGEATHARGTDRLPPGLSFDFIEEEQ